MQTHIPYVALVVGLAALTAIAGAVRYHRLRDDPAGRARLLRWSAISAGLAIVLWLPPLIDQVTGDPGNASTVLGRFRDADETPIGVVRGAEVLLAQLNPWRLITGRYSIYGSPAPGIAFLGIWAAAVASCLRLPAGVARSTVLRVHVVVAAAVALGFVASSRIMGFVWFYLTLWAWGITTLALIATVWTGALVVRHRRGTVREAAAVSAGRQLARRPAAIGAAAVLVAWTAWFTVDALDAEPTAADVSATMGAITGTVTTAIEEGDLPGGPEGPYVVTWSDAINLGATGYGLVSELERAGYDAGVLPAFEHHLGPHRVVAPDDAAARVHIAYGPTIDEWDERDGAELLLSLDPRSVEQRAEFDALTAEVSARLEEEGLDHLVELVDTSPLVLYIDPDLPPDLLDEAERLRLIPWPVAVYAVTGPGP